MRALLWFRPVLCWLGLSPAPGARRPAALVALSLSCQGGSPGNDKTRGLGAPLFLSGHVRLWTHLYPVRRLRISWRMTRSRRETCTWVMPSFSAVACWVWRLRYRSTMRAPVLGLQLPRAPAAGPAGR